MAIPHKAVLMAILICTATASLAQRPPDGWRLPYAEELTDEARNGSPSRFSKAVGDFNGDKVQDAAFVLTSTVYHGEALWVWLSQKSGAHRWINLTHRKAEVRYPLDALTMAVSTVRPGVISYVCFEVPWNMPCDVSPAAADHKLVLKNDSFSYFKPETAASLYFWSHRMQRFLAVMTTND